MKNLWLFVLIAYLIIAIFSYAIIPDKSANANTQIPQLALKPVGFETEAIKKIIKPNTNNFIEKLIYGSNELAIYFPLKNKKQVNDTIIITDYYNKQRKFPLKEVKIVKLKFLLGTDNLGRDFFSRVILGARISLFVGVMAMLLSSLLGFFLGSVAGFAGGRIDNFLQWIMGTLWTLPSVLLALILSFVFGAGIKNLIITIALVSWIDTARIIRGKTIELKHREFVSAAHALGLPQLRILVKHIFPNLRETLIIVSISTLSSAVLLEAGLSFLGFGVEPPTPSWGQLISENYPYLMIDSLQHLAIFPGIAISLLIVSLFGLYNSYKK